MKDILQFKNILFCLLPLAIVIFFVIFFGTKSRIRFARELLSNSAEDQRKYQDTRHRRRVRAYVLVFLIVNIFLCTILLINGIIKILY